MAYATHGEGGKVPFLLLEYPYEQKVPIYEFLIYQSILYYAPFSEIMKRKRSLYHTSIEGTKKT
jgi:hypothetical protein